MKETTSSTAEHCVECGAATVTSALEKHTFVDSGSESNGAELTADIPVWKCSACGYSFIDGDGEAIKHEALCRYRGLLTPQEIKQIRQRHGLTQEELAKLTRFGEASIKRWETGSGFQNASADRFLRLLVDPKVVAKLRAID